VISEEEPILRAMGFLYLTGCSIQALGLGDEGF